MGVHCALCEKSAMCDPFPRMAKVTAVTTVLPDAGPLGFFFSCARCTCPTTAMVHSHAQGFILQVMPSRHRGGGGVRHQG